MSDLRVGLAFRGGAGWLGGLYYLQNLVLALHTLGDEAPDLVGFVPEDDPRARRELAGLLPLVSFRTADQRGTTPARIANRARRAIAGARGVPWGSGAAVERHPVDLLFPAWDVSDGDTGLGLPWIYDLQHVHLPQHFSAEERARRDAAFTRIAERAPIVVVSSETGRDDFAARWPAARGKLRVLRFTTVPLAPWREGDPGEVAARYGVARPYLLLPNQLWVHKNHRVAFEAVRALRERGVDLRLVCTGGTDDPREPDHPKALAAVVEEHALTDRVQILGVVPRDDYVQLLRGAEAVVQPSLFEGWSSTVEDARALGKRLLLSDLPVHREQSPEGSGFFEPHDSEALAGLMEEAHGDAVPEPEALERQAGRVRDYARTFVGIAREAVAAR